MRLSDAELTALCDKYYIENAVSELSGMYDHIERVNPLNTIIEVGVCFGGSLHIWEKTVPVGTGMVIGLEKSPKVLDRLTGREAESKTNKRNDYTVEDMGDNIYKLGSDRQMYVVVGDSSHPDTAAKVAQLLDGRLVDYWFHDGAHYGPVPVYDYHNLYHLIRDDALVCVADTNNLANPGEIVVNGGCQALALALPEPKTLTVRGHRQGMTMWRKQSGWRLDPAAVVSQYNLTCDGPNAGYPDNPADYIYPDRG